MYRTSFILVILELSHIVTGVVVSKILLESKPGCIAKVQTDVGVKWISLQDDYKLVKKSMYSVDLIEEGISLLWRPCVAFDVTLPSSVAAFDNTCHSTNVAVRHKNRNCFSLGNISHFHINNGTVELNYIITDDDRYSARVKLKCNKTKEEGELQCLKNCGSYSPVLQYSSKFVCVRDKPNPQIPLIPHHDLSAGSLILIVVGFIFLVYLSVGIIRGSIRGRSGCDKLPNSDFWLELPILVKDGCRYTFTRRTPRPMYGRKKREKEIYQPIVYDNNIPMVDV